MALVCNIPLVTSSPMMCVIIPSMLNQKPNSTSVIYLNRGLWHSSLFCVTSQLNFVTTSCLTFFPLFEISIHGASNPNCQGCLILHFIWRVFFSKLDSCVRNFSCQVLCVLDKIQPKELSIFQGHRGEKHVVSHCQNILETFSLISLNIPPLLDLITDQGFEIWQAMIFWSWISLLQCLWTSTHILLQPLQKKPQPFPSVSVESSWMLTAEISENLRF